MAPNRRRTDSPLAAKSIETALFERGYEFEFFQAVRLLGRIFPQGKPVGGSAKPSEEFARFGARLSMAFPASAVHDIERNLSASDAGPETARVTVAFLALTGTQGVLPFYYTEWMIARKAAKDDTLAAFLDLFNHRLLSLFYRAWEKHRPQVLYELCSVRGREPDPFTQNLFDLIGMGTGGLRGRMRVKDESLLLYAGLLAQRPHSAAALRSILRDYFGVPVAIDQCLGSWYPLEDTDRCYLSPESERSQLGVGAFIGEEVWSQDSRFRIRVGPVGLPDFVEFLPDGVRMEKLVELTRLIVGDAIVFDVQVSLRAAEVPPCRLDDGGFDAPRLGWMGWLKTSEFTSDANDAVSGWLN
jgi:type VI secretion system protein ImpH